MKTALPFLLAAVLVLLSVPTSATTGHFLHGVGAINAAMGGAGVALPMGPVGSIRANPALLALLEGNQIELSLDAIEGDLAVESTVPTPFGPFSGRTARSPDRSPIPALAWTHRADGSKFGFGLGVLGIAGFKTDFPQDSTNPLFLPQPLGLGRVFADYRLITVPVTFAYQVSPKLSLGAAVHIGISSFTASPIGIVPPDCSSPTDCFFPSAQEDSATGFGARLGLVYQINPKVSFGLTYDSPQYFEDFEWISAVANPNLPTFGTSRNLEFNIDTPQMITAGVGLRPSSKWTVAIDARWINYENADGFGDFGVSPEGAGLGLGWQDILIGMFGAEYRVSPKLALRGGYSISEEMITEETAFVNAVAPAVVRENISLGVGFQVFEGMDLNLAVYKGSKNRVTGPIFGPFGPVPGTSVTDEMEQDSVVVTFSFKH
jgi:long-chain fatty acid transport protein